MSTAQTPAPVPTFAPTPAQVRSCKHQIKSMFADHRLRMAAPHTSKATGTTRTIKKTAKAHRSADTNDNSDDDAKPPSASDPVATLQQLCFDAIVQNHIKRCQQNTVAKRAKESQLQHRKTRREKTQRRRAEAGQVSH